MSTHTDPLHPDNFDNPLDDYTARELGIRVELVSNGRAFLVFQIDTDAGELIEARGCPFEEQARAYFWRVVEALKADEEALI